MISMNLSLQRERKCSLQFLTHRFVNRYDFICQKKKTPIVDTHLSKQKKNSSWVFC